MPQFPEHLPRFQPPPRLARLHAPHGGFPGAGDGVLAASRPDGRLAREAHRLLGLRRGAPPEIVRWRFRQLAVRLHRAELVANGES